MEIEVGVVNGYNNLIQIATDDMQLGFNASVNESGGLPGEAAECWWLWNSICGLQQTSEPWPAKPRGDQRTSREQLEATERRPNPAEAIEGDILLTHDEKKTFLD